MGIERGDAEAARARAALTAPQQECRVAPVHRTGLADHRASVLYGEALLTVEPASRKRQIVTEAARLLRPHGRYGIDELLLTPDGLTENAKSDIQATLTKVLRVARARSSALSGANSSITGITVYAEQTCPLLLLDPKSVVSETKASSGQPASWPASWRIPTCFPDSPGSGEPSAATVTTSVPSPSSLNGQQRTQAKRPYSVLSYSF